MPTATTAADPVDEDRRRGGLPLWWPWAAAAAAVLAIVLGTVAFATSGTSEPAAAGQGPTGAAGPSESPTEKADDRIRVREADYLGRKAKDVKRELEGLGFDVEEQKVDATSPEQDKDTVAAVRPNGLVEPGSTLTLDVYRGYKPPKDDRDDDRDDRDEGRADWDDDDWDDWDGDEKPEEWPDGHPGKGKGRDD
jgi:hypothetical protein